MTEQLSDGVHECRKRHKCWQCNQMIAVGERYHKTKWVDGGEMQTYSAHADCHAAAEYYRKLADLNSDEFPYLDCDLEPEDLCWLQEKFPNVAARLDLGRP